MTIIRFGMLMLTMILMTNTPINSQEEKLAGEAGAAMKPLPETITFQTNSKEPRFQVLEAYGVDFQVRSLERNLIRFKARRTGSEFGFHNFFSEDKHAILPLFGEIYDVVGYGDGRAGVDELTMKRVKDETLLKEIGVDPKNVAVLVRSDIIFGHDESIKTVEIKPESEDKTKYYATLNLHRFVKELGPMQVMYDTKDIDARVGGTIEMSRHNFTVRKIVPPDDKRKILGWVEFSYEKR